MDAERHFFLTGGTGFVGRFLLRNFLLQGSRVTALVRSSEGKSGRERLENALEFTWLPRQAMARLCVIEGQLPDFHPDENDRRRIQACDTIVHAASTLSFQKTVQEEPFRTNLNGTCQLAEVAQRLGLRRWIQVSTAYVCGDTQETVREDEPSVSQPRNSYEFSKRAAEEYLRQQPALDWTIVRPGIVVGDSRTGYAPKFQGIYRCFQSIAFLAKQIRPDAGGKRNLPLRLPLTGNERTNLVPVDWVVSAITGISRLSESIGRHFHLTPRRPATAKILVDAAQEQFGLTGLEFVGRPSGETSSQTNNRTAFERVFDRENNRQAAYFNDDPQFDRSLLDTFLPHLREIDVNREYLTKILQFAETHNWGTQSRHRKVCENQFDCREFFEQPSP